jgi:catechol 2,3-dioxygenase-like lactoylglutathione lyase family enzyme
MTDWFARPVLHVTDVESSIRFYVNQLGFTSPWQYDEDGKARVAQVDRQGCALILADTWPDKIGKGLMFISLNVEPQTREAADAALGALRTELEAKGVLVKEGSWGYRLLVVDDPDGNQLFFNYPNETATAGAQSSSRASMAAADPFRPYSQGSCYAGLFPESEEVLTGRFRLNASPCITKALPIWR